MTPQRLRQHGDIMQDFRRVHFVGIGNMLRGMAAMHGDAQGSQAACGWRIRLIGPGYRVAEMV